MSHSIAKNLAALCRLPRIAKVDKVHIFFKFISTTLSTFIKVDKVVAPSSAKIYHFVDYSIYLVDKVKSRQSGRSRKSEFIPLCRLSVDKLFSGPKISRVDKVKSRQSDPVREFTRHSVSAK